MQCASRPLWICDRIPPPQRAACSICNFYMAFKQLRVGWYRHRFRGRCRGRCHCQHPIPAPAHLPWYHLGTTGASTSTDVDKNTTLGVTIMCEKHFALSAKYIEVIFFTIPIGFCPIFPWYWLSKDKIDSLNQLMVPVPKLVPAPWHHWHRHWHFSSVSKVGTGTNKNWYQPTLSVTGFKLRPPIVAHRYRI